MSVVRFGNAARNHLTGELTHLNPPPIFMARKKLNKKYRHTIRFDKATEDCLQDRAGKKNMEINQYIETLVQEDCKKS